MAVTSKWVTPGTGTYWSTTPRRTRVAVLPLLSTCLCGGRQLASRKVCSGVRNILLKRQISTPCWLRKCSNSSFLPRTPSAFQQARRRALQSTVLLGRAAIFGHERDYGLQDSPQASGPCGEGGDGREEPTSQLQTCWEGKVEEISDFLEWEVEFWMGTTRFGGVVLAAAGLTLGQPSS